DIQGCEIREPLEEARKKRNSLIGDCDGALETIGDREKRLETTERGSK
ncbi:hypothetical protein A2U01_0059758, partial [Trifolium medium]|nr:hypothetical protein [Trifolium medium]